MDAIKKTVENVNKAKYSMNGFIKLLKPQKYSSNRQRK